ncbi:NUDIX domain-containing protein [Kitasatospora sp. NPDC056184]|uniref:NUDIX domain-containing protein n=1 Tax=Kitasatospora sp. NPDC056184 TaxID=3345738 RepID=UPI0035D75E70
MAHSVRLDADVLVLNSTGTSILLIHPTYRPDWVLPGGGIRPGESVAVAARRELREKLGLNRLITHGLTVDQVPADPDTGTPKNLTVVCDGGTVGIGTALAPPIESAREIRAVEWVPLDTLSDHCEPFMQRRIRVAVAAVMHGTRIPLLYRGEPATPAA